MRQAFATVGNTLLDVHHSSYHTRPGPIIASYTALSPRQLKQNRCISGTFTEIKRLSS